MKISKYIKVGMVHSLFLIPCYLLLSALLSSCSTDDDGYITATEDDYPRILLPDFSEWTDGVPGTYKTLTRTTALVDSAVVTPARYTNVQWLIDGEVICEDKHINQYFLAGTYTLKIVATTTMGKTTSRTGMLIVNPAEGDPTIASDAKNLWCQVGTKKTIEGSNLDGITAIYIGGEKAADFVNNGTSLTFTVPNVTLGDQKIILEDPTIQYGCGTVNVTDQEWVDPSGPEVTLWEGKTVINWGDSNVKIATADMANVPVGAKIKVYYNIITADYHAMRVTTPQWGDNPEDNLVQQFDITESTPNPYEFEYTAAGKNLVDSREGMLFVGYGYEITKITYEASEKTLWEGNTTINWGDSNVKISSADLADVKVGSTVSVYYDIVTADYHAMRVTTPQWGDNPEDNLVQQFDITESTPNPYTFVYTEACKNLVDNRDGMLFVGYGYALKKVTIK